jgi:hypothetical protein
MENIYRYAGKYLIFFSGQADHIMYNRGMMITKTQMEKMKMTTTIQPVSGMYIKAVRNDGRIFEGQVENVRETYKGTLVVIKSHANYAGAYRGEVNYGSVYLENCSTVTLDDFPLS